MARPKSVILTPTEKKLALVTTKQAIKEAKVHLAGLMKDQAAMGKARDQFLKAAAREYAAKLAEYERTYKANTKTVTKSIKENLALLSKQEADLLKLSPAVATSLPPAEKAVLTPTE
jgi:S-methylmethionine-dependent homocysteine/selenocysteine methylase